ncbi:hypothetical protein [Sphingopyxis sp. FD7]|jgi:hypothetical protein|uniref:hypothetical protein n=1 Tax=Sphingopyxis sp. FD7 TaxID=1914525 RepID=UPI000DC623FC|nr:hypothetical protein [Sphingopyxis sp. FD7]BBB13921.1 hypothetical protein SPYCA_3179 [Sphingopyxis sp. FD7]
MTTVQQNSPAFMLWCVEGDGKDARWTRIGAAWLHQDGKGFNMRCNAIPLQGRLVARAFVPKADRDAAQGELV